VPFLLAEQRRGWRLMIFCARATRPGSSVWLAGLSGSSERVSGPTNQTNQIDEIDQMNQPSLDARSGRPISPHPWRENERAWRDYLDVLALRPGEWVKTA